MISPIEHPDPPLTPLVVRSGYSLLRGTAMPDRLVELARRLGHTRLAMTDVNNLYGATVFHKAASAAGIAPIIGAHILQDDITVTALVHSQAGYENLCQLITRIHCSEGNPHIAKFLDKFKTAAGGSLASPAGDLPRAAPAVAENRLIANLAELSAGLHLIAQTPDVAIQLRHAGVDAGRLWLGVDTSQPPAQLRSLRSRARDDGLQTVLTASALLADKDDADIARLLAAIRTGSTFDTVAAAELPPARAYLKSRDQIIREMSLIAEIENLADAAANNALIAQECSAFKLLPRRAVFPAFPCPDGLAASGYLRRLCEQGMLRRYSQPSPAAARRLDKELDLITRMGFCEYFLVVWDIVQFARSRGAPVAGRGSGASSLVAYLLGITNVCPLAYDIPFERFLHEKREDFPDLDVDFCWRIRDEVIDYAFRRWGVNQVAMVSMHGTFQARSALRETAKAFGLSDGQISKMEDSDTIQDDEVTQTPSRHRKLPVSATGPTSELRQGRRRSQYSNTARPSIPDLARRILGLPHNLSVHPGGIVIAPGGVDRHVPLEPAAKGVLVTQMDKDGVEDIRLVKLDLLGNRNLSTVRYACDLIRARTGRRIDIESLPVDDPDTVRLLQDARTIGCNQLESPAMRHLLQMMKPHDTRDVMKALALIRPGAASIGMKEVFIRRHRGLEPVPAGPSGLGAVLGDTHGVMLYEDDVMLTAAVLLDCPLPQADRFRKAVQKCHDDIQRLAISDEFLRRCQANGVNLDYAKSMWVQMAKFNAYSFCRAHAASYASLAYAGAYLKAHHPLEFWVAALNNNQSMYPQRVYVEQAKRQGIDFLLPDVNLSAAEFSIDDSPRPAIRVGLARIAGLGPAHVDAIINARRRGPFAGLSDCLARCRLGRNEARSLVLCGAFDWTSRTRPTLMMELNLFYALASWRHSPDVMLLPTGPAIPNVPGDYSYQRKYLEERQILGLSVREHIMTFYRNLADAGPASQQLAAASADSRDLVSRVGRTVRIAGMLEAQRSTTTQRNQAMLFLTMDDEFGIFEVTLFPQQCQALGRNLSHYGPYIITGTVEQQYGAITITAGQVEAATFNQD